MAGDSTCISPPVPRSQLRLKFPFVLLTAVAILAGALLFRLSPARGVAISLSAFLLMALPGAFIGLALFGWNLRRQPESLIFGVPLGVALSSYVALMLGYLVDWSAPLIVVALLILTALTGICALRYRFSPLLSCLRPWSSIDHSVLGGMALAVLGFVAVPFSRVGELTPDGYAYTWLFGFDFLIRAAHAASITIGLPVDYIHMAGMPLHIYLVGYVLPAFAYSLSNETVHPHAIVLVTAVLLDLVFVACLFAFLRLFAKSTKSLLATAVVALIGYSYYGPFVIARHFAPLFLGPFGTRLQQQFAFRNVSHLYQRSFMAEPYAILALSVFLFVVTVVLSSGKRQGFSVSCLLGLAIGVDFGIDCWLGITLAAWFAGVQLMRLSTNWRDRNLWVRSLLAVGVAAMFLATFFMVHMVSFSNENLISIHLKWWGVKFGILQYITEFGPMLLLGTVGLVLLWRIRRFQALSVLLIVALAVSQDLFVTIGPIPRFRTGNRLLPLALLVGVAWLFQNVKFTRARKWLVLGMVALAMPTVMTDIVGASNVLDESNTYYVRPADMEACEWIRTHLPRNAIVQSKPDYISDDEGGPSVRSGDEISLIPEFAFRRSALGAEFTAKSMCAGCGEIASLRKSDLDTMFRSSDAQAIALMAAKYKIDYLYVGPYEQNKYPALLGVLNASSIFKEVYDRDSVHIFRIAEENR